MSRFMIVLKTFLLAVIILFAAGCIAVPHTSEVAPAIKGQIVDKGSGKPISDAKILYIVKAENRYSEIAVSDKNGNFQTEAPTQWHYIVYIGSPGHYPVPDKLYVIERQLHISKDGYAPKRIVLNEDPSDALKRSDFGVIKLSGKSR